MLRRISGSGFAVVLIAIIAFKHAALGFCLCQEQLILSNCDCPHEAPATAPASCGCCEEETAEAQPDPCHDCVVPITIETGDFLWSAASFSPLEQENAPLPPFSLPHHDALAKPCVIAASGPARGSPPPGPPLFLRTQVLRL